MLLRGDFFAQDKKPGMNSIWRRVHTTDTPLAIAGGIAATSVLVASAAATSEEHLNIIATFPRVAQRPLLLLANFRRYAPKEYDAYLASLCAARAAQDRTLSLEAEEHLKQAFRAHELASCKNVARYVRKWTRVVYAACKQSPKLL